MHHPITVSSNTCSLTHVQTKHSLAHLQDLLPTLAGNITYNNLIPAIVRIKPCRCARECFICTCVRLHVFELTVKEWCIWIIVTYIASSVLLNGRAAWL